MYSSGKRRFSCNRSKGSLLLPLPNWMRLVRSLILACYVCVCESNSWNYLFDGIIGWHSVGGYTLNSVDAYFKFGAWFCTCLGDHSRLTLIRIANYNKFIWSGLIVCFSQSTCVVFGTDKNAHVSYTQKSYKYIRDSRNVVKIKLCDWISLYCGEILHSAVINWSLS